MRIRSILLCLLLAAVPLAFARSTHRTHIVNTDTDTEVRLVRESDGDSWASFERGGVRYVTHNTAVVAEVEKALEAHRELSEEHSRLGRRHSDLGREHAALGREHARLGREHARLARRASTSDVEREQRALEAEQRKLEDKQRALEDRQRDLEQQQRDLEAKQRAADRDTNRKVEQIFERAVKEGKAKRE